MMKRALASLPLLFSACFDPPAGDDDSTTAATTTATTTATTSGVATGSGGDTLDGTTSEESGEVEPTCDDGVVGGDETDVDCGGSCGPCDDGQGCAGAEDCSSGVCEDQICQAPSCGDGVVHEGEACDDGGPSDTCTDQCVLASCGDGVVQTGEDCDDGGESAACNADCSQASCGDAQVNAAAGEQCDAGGESAECNVDCTTASCGDLQVNEAAGEECDEGDNTASCDADCTTVLCGDGFTNPVVAEECDDGGESAVCDADCTAVVCGDGTINMLAGEECEGGAPDICGPACQFTGCGPDPVILAMAACMATYPSCDPVAGGIVGYGPGESAGSNCGPPADEWRFYCTETTDTNFNCSPCTVGEVLGPHDPCNCNAGTSPVLGQFCVI